MSSPFGSRGAAPQITQIPLSMKPTIAGAAPVDKLGSAGRADVVPPLPELPRAPRLEDFVPPPPAPVAPPELPPLSEVLESAESNAVGLQAPALQPTPLMPAMESRATAAAALRVRQAIAAREGRASTLLTTPAARRSSRAVRPTLAGNVSPYARITRG